MFTSSWFSSAQGSFIQKFKLDFCGKICRAHTVWTRSKTQEAQDFVTRKFSSSLKKDFIFQLHLYFPARFAVYFLVSYTYFQTSMMTSFNFEMLNCGKNLPLQTLFIKSDVAIATFKNLLNMAILEKHLNKTGLEEVS